MDLACTYIPQTAATASTVAARVERRREGTKGAMVESSGNDALSLKGLHWVGTNLPSCSSQVCKQAERQTFIGTDKSNKNAQRSLPLHFAQTLKSLRFANMTGRLSACVHGEPLISASSNVCHSNNAVDSRL